eukprot:TRINITY_DN251_c0_g1_i2.p1 TRINITY_DN251_c0_g1~~TRINITY_DN251_c0_g1_i2.p1  ORF type:complete len:485 (+),score=116.58 TRINITY_DN251_c0_g1_i2:30-1484(+)
MVSRGRLLLLAAAVAVAACVAAGQGSPGVMVVPQPRAVVAGGGSVRVGKGVTLLDSYKEALNDKDAAEYIENAFQRCVRNTMKAQDGLHAWTLSLHPEIQYQVNTTVVAPTATVSSVRVVLGKQPFPALDVGVDESYTVQVNNEEITLNASTVWGVLHAFETVAQLINWDGKSFTIQHTPLLITDAPRYPWRGMLVDTARHFIPLDKLKQLVDGLSAMKFNVLHLHLTDAQSFPFEVSSYKELSGKGAFDPNHAVYTHDDMSALIEHARSRGMVVMPEFDLPGHTASWGLGYPGVTASCWDYLNAHQPDYPENGMALNPADSRTFPIVDAIVADAASVFASCAYVNVGGDEVDHGCWQNAPQHEAITTWMQQNNVANFSQLEAYFTRYAQEAVVKNKKTPMVWEDAFTVGGALPESIIGIWRSKEKLAEVVHSGRKALLLYGYYQDMEAPLCTQSLECPECTVNWLWIWTYVDMYGYALRFSDN